MVPYSALILAPPALLLEGRDLLKWLGSLQNPLPAFAAILASGFFAFCLNYALFYTIQKTRYGPGSHPLLAAGPLPYHF